MATDGVSYIELYRDAYHTLTTIINKFPLLTRAAARSWIEEGLGSGERGTGNIS